MVLGLKWILQTWFSSGSQLGLLWLQSPASRGGKVASLREDESSQPQV